VTPASPGLWEAVHHEPDTSPSDGAWVIYRAGTNHYVAETNEEGNARLLAEAPALLASCKELREALMGAMRVCFKAGLTDAFMAEMRFLCIEDDIGNRSAEVIDAAVRGRR
jgi:hypothetical protein